MIACIRRFVTTNYDLELEIALMNAGEITGSELFSVDYDLDAIENLWSGQLQPALPSNKSFTQRYRYCEQLSRFSLARHEASEYMVFHCHGRVDDIGSCVITEEDYRHWYLRDDEEVKARQQTMDVLLSSNPLLLVGYSMGDPEFMQLLQFVHANRLNDPNRSPLFALLYVPAGDEDNGRPMDDKVLRDICVSLHARYGAHVIPIHGERETLVHKLVGLKTKWFKWWEWIQAKPLVKTFSPPRDKSYFHYRSKQLDETSFINTRGYDNLERELVQLIETQSDDKRFAVLTGPAGTGKTWSTQWFAIRLSSGQLHASMDIERHSCHLDRKVFFWSSYYTNDLFTGIKRALKFFGHVADGNPVRPENMLEKFAALLNKEKALLIFDGIERLLQPVDNVADGKAVNQDVARFFNIIRESKKAFVILTSRQWPIDILSTKDPQYEHWKKRLHLRAPKCLSGDLKDRQGSVYQSMTDEKRFSLCSLLEGHIYCLSLIEKMIDKQENKSLDETITDLLRVIVSTPTDRRPERVIRAAIEYADESFNKKSADAQDRQMPQGGKCPVKVNIPLKFLERVALFMNPIEKQVLKVCLTLAIKEIYKVDEPDEVGTTCLGEPDEVAANSKYEPSDALVDSVISCLVERSLLLEIEFNDTTENGYTVHPLLQKYVRKRLHHSVFSSHPSMILLTLGKALLLANQRDLGIAYLKSARLMAKEQGYFLREAEAELRQAGEEINP